ncbi:TetR/AcrR family transcriptional regulator [Gluconobacter sp. R71646]|uniref:TetR/AcrR family transcriptional regulator n=1 Tax=Gluconobacter potus TaxID=2724927 RepID=A0ABR9YNQ8_9PROT|nr:TetR/AcrR family transcriptional regulator [Gluconobacter sp. R71656]MBF0868485.1 TetR/AcrR family transcriptional regulator [Gluconobacter sp. R75628]MBF0874467.1 TetR/AcrR family transcriptional regulator [Gluconobacter sp. R75629]MBF0883458.1 TetR/AcrR family transcriptional regulator [Gluconobacter potus]
MKASTAGSGRKRSQEATKDAQAAALKLAYDLGPERVTMEAIASHSGVAKTTLYRRWNSAAAVVMDAFLSELTPRIAYRAGRDVRQTLVFALEDLSHALDEPRRKLLRHMVAAAQSSSVLEQAFWDRWIAPRRKAGIEALEQFGVATETGELMLDLLYGAFYYRMLIPYAPITDIWIQKIVDQVS